MKVVEIYSICVLGLLKMFGGNARTGSKLEFRLFKESELWLRGLWRTTKWKRVV